jgi:hypothetical protein
MDQEADESGGRFQVRLWDLIVVVVGASYVLDVARRSKLAWGGGVPDLAHAIGLLVLTLGVGVGLVVVGQWVRRIRDPRGRAMASLWRILALGWLAGSIIEVAAALQVVSTPGTRLGFGDPGEMRLRISALMATLGMVGLTMASYPLGTRVPSATPKPRPRWGSWPSVILASVVGIAILGLGHGTIPYLVLLAMEAVRNAMTRAPLVARPIVFDRLITACLEALPGLVGCLLTAVWVDDDLRDAARDPLGANVPRSWLGMIARFLSVLLAVSGLGYVVLVSLPTLNPWLTEGLSNVVDRSTIATVVLGFAALAAGFSARAAARLTSGNGSNDQPTERALPPRRLGDWPRRILGGMVAVFCLEIIAAAVQAIRRDLEVRWYIPISLDAWTSIFQEAAGWLSYSRASFGSYLLFDRLDDFLIATAAIWLTIRLANLIATKHAGRPIPLDTLADDRVALGRFLGWWIGLTTVLIASLPGLVIVAVTLLHFVVKWIAT